MVFVRYTLSVVYLLLFALFFSFVYGIAGFAVFGGMEEEAMSAVFMPSWVFVTGALVVFADKWWRIKNEDLEAKIWGVGLSIYGYLLMIWGIYLFGEYVYLNGLDENFWKSAGMGLSVAVCLWVLYGWRLKS